jgi:hypothetical protein
MANLQASIPRHLGDLSLPLAIPGTILTTLTTLTIHELGRWLALELLLQVARLYDALLPLALSLIKSSYLGDKVRRRS